MDDAHRFDIAGAVFGQSGLYRVRIGPVAPVGRYQDRIQPAPDGQVLPSRSEMAGLAHQHFVAGRQTVDQCRFPGPGSRGRIYDHGLLGRKNLFQFLQHAECES